MADSDYVRAPGDLQPIALSLARAFEQAPIGMALVDMNRRRVHVNDALCRLTGYSRNQLLGTTIPAITHPDDVSLSAEDRQRLLSGEISSYQIEKRYLHALGHYVRVLVTVSLVRDRQGRPLHFVSHVQELSGPKADEHRLEDTADLDIFTGLFNRRALERELAREVRRVARYKMPAAFLFIDLDRFKDINERLGRKAGDDVLKSIAHSLTRRVRRTDTLARVAGDRFAVILPQTDATQAQIAADGIVKAFRRAVPAGDGVPYPTVSVGVVSFDGMTDAEVLRCAERALYEAKDAGGDQFAVYVPGSDGQNLPPARTAALDRIYHALDENRLRLYCQPIVDLASNIVSQYELLLRLEMEPGVAPLPPSAFLGVAEDVGIIQAIDCWVIRQAIALVAEQLQAGRSLILHVNVSAKSIGDPEFAAKAEAALAETTIDPGHLIFELTETAAITNLEDARNFTNRLRKAGCQFALDDFGAGFGSFYNLKYLPFDILKIDGEFIRNFASGPIDQLVVNAIVTMAKGMGKKTVAEFVEDAHVSRMLRDSGVDYGQGYYLGHPRPVREVLAC